MKDITSKDTMRELQGDRVVVLTHDVDGVLYVAHVLTLVRLIDLDHEELRMVNRDSKRHKPDWPLSQAMFDHFKPADPEDRDKLQAKWQVTIKPRG